MRFRGWQLGGLALGTAGILSVAGCVALALISARFPYGTDALVRPVVPLVALMMTMGLVYMCAAAVVTRTPFRGAALAWMIAIGLAMRAVLMTSTPILEDDYYRYLWDGGVTAHGINPYEHAPADIRFPPVDRPEISDVLQELAADSGTVIARVNHPKLTTVYPPVAQVAFAIAHWIEPWSHGALRGVFFGFDLATFLLLLIVLKRIGRPLQYAAIYWWNPIVVMEFMNAAHMDAIVLPFVMLAVLFAIQTRPLRMTTALVLGIASKLWPILLAPLLFRRLGATRQRYIAAAALGAVLLGALFAVPLAATLQRGEDSGLIQYVERWEMNDALFMIVHKTAQIGSGVLGFESRGPHADVAARILVLLLLLAWTVYHARKLDGDPLNLCNRLVLVMGAFFLLSPTQFPWYYTWLVPFLALAPRRSLLLLTVMLPMYYLKFYYSARDDMLFFHNRIVWIEYAPVFCLILWEWYSSRRNQLRSNFTPTGAA